MPHGVAFSNTAPAPLDPRFRSCTCYPPPVRARPLGTEDDCGCSVNRYALAWCLPGSLSVSCGCLVFQPFPAMRHLPSSATSPLHVLLPNVLSTRRPTPMWDVCCASTVWFSAFFLMVVASTMRAEPARAGYDCRLALFLEGGAAGAMPKYSPTHCIHSSTGSVLCLHSQHSHRPLHLSPLPFLFVSLAWGRPCSDRHIWSYSP